MSTRRLFALVSSQGTACSETCFCSECGIDEVERGSVFTGRDAPVPGTWTDVTDNDALYCCSCGWHPNQVQKKLIVTIEAPSDEAAEGIVEQIAQMACDIANSEDGVTIGVADAR